MEHISNVVNAVLGTGDTAVNNKCIVPAAFQVWKD